MTPKEFIEEMQNGVLLENYSLKDMEWFMKHYAKRILEKPVSVHQTAKFNLEKHLDDFVTWDLAIRMWRLGYRENAFGFWNANYLDCAPRLILEYSVPEIRGFFGNDCVAPMWQEAFKWARKKYFAHYSVQTYFENSNSDKPENELPYGAFIDVKLNGYWMYYEYEGRGDFKTYEETQEAILTYILDFIEKNYAR